MPQRLIHEITTPADGAVVGRSIAVQGRTLVVGRGFPEITLDGFDVTFSDGGHVAPAGRVGTEWRWEGSPAPTSAGGSTLTITATVSGTVKPDDDHLPEPFDPPKAVSVDVTLEDREPETLKIDAFTSPVIPRSLPYHLDLKGTAGDAVSGIRSVQVQVGGGAFVDAIDAGDGFARWLRPLDLGAGEHHLTVRAVDGVGNSRTATADLTVEVPSEPGAVDQIFQPTRYLQELVEFAARYVEIDGSTGALTAGMLAERFHQPFDRLSDIALSQPAARSVAQSRIAVEVLRGRLGSPAPQPLDQRYRALAYQTLLQQVGTSYDELRLARNADSTTRRSLATRLGIAMTATRRPDRLDELTLSPDLVSDEKLEALFGYRSTAPSDSLGSLPEAASFSLWQRDALGAQWSQEDALQRDSAAGPQPIIDPDIIGDGHVRNRHVEDPAFSLLTARRRWIEETLAKIEAAANDGGDPLTRFDELVLTYIGALDVAGLAARDADGADIGPDLAAVNLDLRAFRFLAHCRELLAAGELLDTEMHDVVSILLQIQKLREYRHWRLEERRASIVLAPSSFIIDAADPTAATAPPDIPHWRVKSSDYTEWRRTLAARAAALETVENSSRRGVDATEGLVLPALRDALIAEIATQASLSEEIETATDQLTRELMIDLREASGRTTTRADQALETLQGVLFSARVGRLDVDGDGREWTIGVTSTDERDFDREWSWMGSYRSWLAAMRVFAYPENQLLPALYVDDPGLAPPTAAFRIFIEKLRDEGHVTPPAARRLAAEYLEALRAPTSGVPLEPQLKKPREDPPADPPKKPLELNDEKSDSDLVQMQVDSTQIYNPDRAHQREIFWLVPMALASKLQECGQFQAALDWYQTVFAFHLPRDNQKIYAGLAAEKDTTSNFGRGQKWLITDLNPHRFARERRNCYTRSTVMSIVGCLHAFADAEFSRNTAEGNSRARTLYEMAADLLDLDVAQPESGEAFPFPTNPVWVSLREYGRSSLAKLHSGLNIAGMSFSDPARGSQDTVLPSPYRYPVLIERAKNLVGIAQHVEAAFLSTLEQRDAKTYDALQAGQHLEVAQSTVALHDVKVADAAIGTTLAGLQLDRSVVQRDHFTTLIFNGLNEWEQAALDDLKFAKHLHDAAAGASVLSGIASIFLEANPFSGLASALSSEAAAVSTRAQIAQTKASFERREEDWGFQRGLATVDIQIAGQQALLAQNQFQLALQERELSALQMEHAAAVVEFLATRFTNAELFEWMSGVLGRVYAYFLQQATALAQLAEAQLAFERQELPSGFVRSDYWRDSTTTDNAGGADRRGLTGSARLLQDTHRLDQYAFDTDRRKLHLTQTFPLSQIVAFELQLFRDTGVLTFATPEVLFDREFPGHYLRLIKRIRISLIALLPAMRGVRATLSASGVSRTVVARGSFSTVTLRREPESIAFTSPINATGLFELEPETGLLLPFEGMGVDTVWRLELPKAANPFDFRSIADVVLTVEYTALDSAEYRQHVIRELDRRFTGDRAFSLRNDYPDAWFDLNNPDTVEPDRRMTAVIPITTDDLPPHIEDLLVEHLTLFVLRKDSFTSELTVTSLSHTSGGQTSTGGEVHTTAGIVSTRRPGGAPWLTLVGANPVGNWELRLPDDAPTRSWFSEELIEDIVVVITLSGNTPAWP
jgi:hypothetical protein